MDSKVLLLSYGKSGTLLMVSIIRAIQEQNGIFSSYKRSIGLDRVIETLCAEYIHQPNIPYVDQIEYDYDRKNFNLIFPHPRLQQIEVDLGMLDACSSLINTHTSPDIVRQKTNLFDRRQVIYIYRDGRDVLNSWIHFTIQATIQSRNPQYRHRTTESLLSDSQLLAGKVKQWDNHLKAAGNLGTQVLMIKFEDLIREKARIATAISKFLNLDCSLEAILAETSLNSMQASSPEHVRKGTRGDWRNYFQENHKDLFKELAGETLIEFGYESDISW